MKIIKILLLLTITLVFNACNKDDEIQNNPPVLADVELNITESPKTTLITTLVATDKDNDVLTYSIVNQTPSGSIAVESTTGKVTVVNGEAFIYDNNTKVTATIKVSDDKSTITAQLIINIEKQQS